jgi:hypothetical protein
VACRYSLVSLLLCAGEGIFSAIRFLPEWAEVGCTEVLSAMCDFGQPLASTLSLLYSCREPDIRVTASPSSQD